MRIWIPGEEEHFKIVMDLELRFLDNNEPIISTFYNDLFFENGVDNWIDFFINSINEEATAFLHAVFEDEVLESFVI